MALSPGSRLGPYEITGTLGAGGMGEVYRATDTRLNRVVALKALHSLLAGDPERVSRFDREAHLLASLSHPNIAAIHGVEEVGGEKYLALEFVDGHPLSELLKKGALPIDEALGFARQIADGIAAAHERGIIHRDIKPGNIMVTAEGIVKVLDFGLGKVLEGESPSNTVNSPTITLAATQAGLIMGTAAYMSPEQAKGRNADKRSDVWAFGCVLFEMVTGRRAFDGEDVTETLAAIVRGEPDWKLVPAELPRSVRDVIERCLVKNRNERLGDMSVVRFVLNERVHSGAVGDTAAPTPSTQARSIGWPLAAVLIVVASLATAGVTRWWAQTDSSVGADGVTRLSMVLPDGDQISFLDLAPVAISPDGLTIAYSARRGGTFGLYVRGLSDAEPRALPGTENAASPFFSPDGQWIAFFGQSKLKKIAVTGAGLSDLADATDGRGGTWGTDDVLYYAPTNAAGIWRVPASGGTPAEVTRPDPAKGEVSHLWPQALVPDQTLLFGIRKGPGPDEHVIVSQSLKTGERRSLVTGGDMPRFVRTGHLIYGRFDALFAVPWNPAQPDLAGAVPLTLPETPRLENEAASDYAVSENGTLVYVAGGPARIRNRIVSVDRAGKPAPLPLPEKEYQSIAAAPDGRHAILQVLEGTVRLWMLDLDRHTTTPFLVSGGSSQAPVWMPDGKHVIYRGTRSGFRNLYRKSSDGTGPEGRLTNKGGVIQTPNSVSPDGKWLLYSESGVSGANNNIHLLPLDESGTSREPRPFLPAGEFGINGQFSPDGRWVAYVSGLSGRTEVYVRPFPGPGARTQVSTAGADQPRWSRDGRSLYFSGFSQEILGVDLSIGSSITASVPRVLHEGHYKNEVNGNTAYDVTRDGRFLMVQQGETSTVITRIDVVLNWFSQLKGATPTQ